jgi:hypothetical protein
MLLMLGLRKLKLLRKFVSIARHTYNLGTYSYKTEMLGTMHWAVLFGYNILQLSEKKKRHGKTGWERDNNVDGDRRE